jgi:hypothetical protein
MPAATPITPPEPALQTQDGPWGESLPPLTFDHSPTVTSSISSHSPATPSNPFALAADTVIAEDMVMEVVEQPVLDPCEQLKRDYQSDAWFADCNNLQDLKLLDGVVGKGAPCDPHCQPCATAVGLPRHSLPSWCQQETAQHAAFVLVAG